MTTLSVTIGADHIALSDLAFDGGSAARRALRKVKALNFPRSVIELHHVIGIAAATVSARFGFRCPNKILQFGPIAPGVFAALL